MLRLPHCSLPRRGFSKRSRFLRHGLGGEPVEVLGRAALKSLRVIAPIRQLFAGNLPAALFLPQSVPVPRSKKARNFCIPRVSVEGSPPQPETNYETDDVHHFVAARFSM